MSDRPGPARQVDGLDDPMAPASSPALDWVRRNIWYIGAALGILVITGTRPFLVKRPDPPPIIATVPDFELVDQDGKPFAKQDMQGDVWVVGFIFTRCQSLCPPISAAMVRFQEHLLRSQFDDVQMLTITVDPDYDKPEVLKAYAEKLGAEESQWRFITGSKEDIEALVVGGFKLAIGEVEEESPGVFDIAHASRLALVDRQGNVRGLYRTDDEGLEELYHRILAVRRIK